MDLRLDIRRFTLIAYLRDLREIMWIYLDLRGFTGFTWID